MSIRDSRAAALKGSLESHPLVHSVPSPSSSGGTAAPRPPRSPLGVAIAAAAAALRPPAAAPKVPRLLLDGAVEVKVSSIVGKVVRPGGEAAEILSARATCDRYGSAGGTHHGTVDRAS